MNGESLQSPDRERLVMGDSDTRGVVIPGILESSLPDKSDPEEGNDIVAVTINLNRLSKGERMNLFKVIEPYDNSMTVVKKQDLKDNVNLNSLERGLKGPGDMLKNTYSRMQQSVEAPMIKAEGLSRQLNAERGLKNETNGPTLNGKLPNVNLDTPGTNGGAKFTMPTFGMSGPAIKGADLDGSHSSPRVNSSTPNLSTPNASLDLTASEVNTGELIQKPSKFKMPQFNTKAPNGDANVSAGFKGAGLRGEMETPNLNISPGDIEINANDVKMNLPNADLKTADVDIEPPSGKFKWTKPKFGLPGAKMKGSQLNLSSPDMNLTTPNIDQTITAPNVDMQSPEVTVEAPSGKFKWPYQKKPKLSFSGPKVKTPSVDVKANLKTPAVGLSGLNIESEISQDVNLPKADLSGPKLDVKSPGKAKLPKLKKPKFGQSSAKVKTPDIDVNTNLKASTLSLSVPQVNEGLEKPTLDVKSPSGKFKWLNNLKKPKNDLSLPKVTGPDDLNLSTPNINEQINAPVANACLPTVDLKGPDVDFQTPEVDIRTPSGKSKFPTLKMPKVNWSGNKVKGPDLNIDANMKTPNMDLSAPEVDLNLPRADLKGPNLNLASPAVEADLSVPDVDLQTPEVDLKAPSLKSTFPTLKMPKVNWSGNKVKGPDLNVDANMKTPNMDLSAPEVDLNLPRADLKGPNLNLSSPAVEADLSVPDVDLQTPEVDLKAPSLKSTFPNLKMPKVNWSGNEVKGPDLNIDANMKTPNMDLSAPDVDLNLPRADLKGPNLNLASPAVEADLSVPDLDLQTPEVDMKAPSLKSTFPNVKMPKVNWSGNKVKGPDLNIDANMKTPNMDLSAPDVDLNLPQADLKGSNLNLSSPDVEADLSVPDVDLQTPEVDMKAPSLKSKFPTLKMPKVNWSGNKVKGPDLNIDANMKTPNMDLSAPEVDLNLPRADLKGSNLNLSSPDVEADLSVPDVDLQTPEVDMKAPSLKSKFPTLKMPKINWSGNKVKGPDLNIDADMKTPNLSAPGVNVNLPQAGLKGSMLNLAAPAIEGDIAVPGVGLPEADLKVPDGKFKLKKIKWPKKRNGDLTNSALNVDVNLPKADMKEPDLNLKTTDFNLSEDDISASDHSISLPEVDLTCPNVALQAPDVNLDQSKSFKLPKLNLPNFGLAGSKVDGENLDHLKASDINISAPGVDVNMPKTDLLSSSLSTSLPKAVIKGSKVCGHDLELASETFKLPNSSLPQFGLKGPDVKGHNLGADLKGKPLDVTVPDVDLETSKVQMKTMNLSTPNFQGTINVPGLSTSLPKAAIKGQNVDVQALEARLDVPSVVELKNRDLNMSAPKIQGTITTPNQSTSLNKADIECPDVDLKTMKLNLSARNLQDEVNTSEIDINVPNPDHKGSKANLTSPVVEMEAPTKVPHFKLPSFGFSSPKLKGSSCEVDAPDKNVLIPSIDNKHVPTVDLKYTPENNVQNLKGTEVELKPPDVNIETPSEKLGLVRSHIKQPNTDANTDVSTPAVAVSVPKVEGKYSSPKLSLFSHVKSSGSDTEDSGEEGQSEDETESRQVDVPMFSFHRLPQNKIDSAFQEAAGGMQVKERTINIMERLQMFKSKKPVANFLPDVKHELSTPPVDVCSTTDADSSTKIRSGTFKVTKPESGLGLEYPVMDTSEGHDSLSISLSNMLGLNIKQN